MKRNEFYERYWKDKSARENRDDSGRKIRKNIDKYLIRRPESGLVLDAGCGNGELVSILAGKGFKTIGVDISLTATLKGKEQLAKGMLGVASIEEGLPFIKERFSTVVCIEVLEHLFDIHEALSELNRIIVPNGHLLLTVPYHGILKNAAIALLGFERHYNPYLSHVRFFTRKSLESCLGNAGFQRTLLKGIGRFWPLWNSILVIAQKMKSPGHSPEIIG